MHLPPFLITWPRLRGMHRGTRSFLTYAASSTTQRTHTRTHAVRRVEGENAPNERRIIELVVAIPRVGGRDTAAAQWGAPEEGTARTSLPPPPPPSSCPRRVLVSWPSLGEGDRCRRLLLLLLLQPGGGLLPVLLRLLSARLVFGSSVGSPAARASGRTVRRDALETVGKAGVALFLAAGGACP